LWGQGASEPPQLVTNCLKVDGPLDTVLLKACFAEVERRHESARTGIELIDQTPVQRIHPPGRFVFEVTDLSQVPSQQQDDEARRLIDRIRVQARPFGSAPFLEVHVFRTGPQAHIIFVALNHMIADATSLDILMGEVCYLYEALENGKQPSLPALAMQYAEYALQQRTASRQDNFKQLARLATQRLEGAGRLRLPADNASRPQRGEQPTYQPIAFPSEFSDSLKSVGRKYRATPFEVFLSAIVASLASWSDNGFVSIAFVNNTRTSSALASLLGNFVDLLFMKVDIRDQPTFAELIDRTKQACRDALRDFELPSYLVTHNPAGLASIAINWVSAPDSSFLRPAALSPNLRTQIFLTKPMWPYMSFDVWFSIWNASSGLRGFIQYSPSALRPETVRAQITRVRQALGAVRA
jgi:hypothetical protein